MATRDQHIAQFEHNVAVVQRLSDTEDFDWAVTALFCAALHLIQAYIVERNDGVASHGRRDRLMRSREEFRPVLGAYRTLRDYSEHARYECRQFSRQEFEGVRDGVFAQVVDYVRPLIGDS